MNVAPRTSAIIQDTLTVILAGGQGERLYPLTKHRAKPAVPFGGIYRIIDFALSNCLNSYLKRICVLTQYKSDSLDRHIRLGWNIFHYERGEFIYKMDYSQLLESHVSSGADVTVSTTEFAREYGSHLGVLEVDPHQRIIGFDEKPQNPKPLPDNPDCVLASMGIYVFNTPVLIRALMEDAETEGSHDFGRNIIPNLIGNKRVFAYNFQDRNRKKS